MRKNKPKISIILPVYNTDRYLDESVQSILNQTFKDFELIIIDDSSTDNSVRIINKYLKDKRICFIQNKENKGISYNRNLGLKTSRSNFVAIADSDDINYATRLEKQYNFLQENEHISIVGSYVHLIDENGNIFELMKKPTAPEDILAVCFFMGPFVQPSTMFRKDRIMAIGAYREKYTVTQDIDLYFRILFSGLKGANLPIPLVKFRKHGNSTDRYYRKKGKTSFRLKKEMIKKFSLKLSLKEKISMYIHFVLDMTLTFEQKVWLEKIIKKIMI